MQQSGPTPDLQAQAQTGLKDSAFVQSQKGLIYAQVQGVLGGQPIQANPEIDASVAVQIITTLMNTVGQQDQQILQQLLQQYQQSQQNEQQKESADNLAVQTAGGMKQ